MKKITIIFLILTINTIAQNKEVIDVENLNAKTILSQDLIDLETELKTNEVTVKVIKTCSTNSNLCGTMAFGSASLVEIANGKYKNQLLYVLALCKETNYEVSKLYNLKITKAPSFGLRLCDNIIYDKSWTKNSKEKKPMIFGDLK